jgi:hypothetical protein
MDIVIANMGSREIIRTAMVRCGLSLGSRAGISVLGIIALRSLEGTSLFSHFLSLLHGHHHDAINHV